MTDRETALLKSLIQWMRDAAERSTKSGRPDEAMGLMRAAARLEQELPKDA